MQNETHTLIELMLAARANEIDAANIQLTSDIVEEHRHQRMRRRADPPSDAEFAHSIGFKPDAYAKTRRNLQDGGAPRLSRTSLAKIVLANGIDNRLRAKAFQLLWLTQLHHGKAAAKQTALVRQALCSREHLSELARIVSDDAACFGPPGSDRSRLMKEEGRHADASRS